MSTSTDLIPGHRARRRSSAHLHQNDCPYVSTTSLDLSSENSGISFCSFQYYRVHPSPCQTIVSRGPDNNPKCLRIEQIRHSRPRKHLVPQSLVHTSVAGHNFHKSLHQSFQVPSDSNVIDCSPSLLSLSIHTISYPPDLPLPLPLFFPPSNFAWPVNHQHDLCFIFFTFSSVSSSLSKSRSSNRQSLHSEPTAESESEGQS